MYTFRFPIFLQIFIGCLLLSGIPTLSYAQEVWTGVTLRVKPLKRVNVDLEQQFRFEDGFSSLYSRFTELGIGYDLTKRLEIGAAYRHTDRSTGERVDDDRRRISAEASYTFGSDETAFTLAYRLRYQSAQTRSEEGERDDYIRNRLALDYNLTKRVQPYVTTELFYKLNQVNMTRAFWFTMGLKSSIGKSFGINTFYRVEKELNKKRPQNNHIIGLMLTYRLKLYNKKDTDDNSQIGGY